MLHHSLPGSVESSAPPSPHRRLTEPFRSGRGTPSTPLRGAEFVASSPASQPSPNGISATAFSPNYFERFFVEERELGRGGKGVVLLVKHVLDGVSLGHFALKRIPVGAGKGPGRSTVTSTSFAPKPSIISTCVVGGRQTVKLRTVDPMCLCSSAVLQYGRSS